MVDSEEPLDPVRTYSLDEEREIAMRLIALETEIEAGAHLHVRFETSYLARLHRSLFEGIRGFAGRLRARGDGSEVLHFGPNRSVHRDRVSHELQQCFEKTRRSIASIDDNPEHPDRERASLHLAVWTHAEVVRIHPFEDGNGRASRLLMSSLLVRTGLFPIAVETAKQTYCDGLNHYFSQQDMRPLLHLMLRLSVEQLESEE